MDFSDGFQASYWFDTLVYARTKEKKQNNFLSKAGPSNGVPYKTSLRTGAKLAEIG